MSRGPGGAPLRESARRWRQHDLALPIDEPIAAPRILTRCAETTGYTIAQLGAGDPLLAGALAVLDRDARSIWIDGTLASEHRLAILAHEFAHLTLHSACSPDDYAGSADFSVPDEDGFDAAAGYSPRQRREVDANIWAAELLIPEPMLRRAFYGDALGAPEIAARLELDVALVRAQMGAVLLRPVHGESVRWTDDPREAPAEPGLDPSQAAAAGVGRGPYLLAAGPGTGKTRTLVARCVHLVSDKCVAPESILALTFSRKAAAEMRERLIAAGVGTAVSGPWVGTFHSFCLETLRRYGHAVGLSAGWRIAGETEAFGMLERYLPRLKLRELSGIFHPTRHLNDILKSISRAKDEFCSPERFAELVQDHVKDCVGGPGSDEALRLIEAARVYSVYQQILSESNRLDYGDLIVKTVDLLESSPEIARSLQSQYRQIVADEYQDVNYASARLLRLLAGEEAKGLWAVGDRRQSIYRFRGASPANVAQFDKDYPNGRRGVLGVNYRSRPRIVRLVESAARRLSAAEPDPFRGWECSRTDEANSGVKLAVADTPASQAAGMAAEMRRLHAVGLAFADQVVLVRSHNQAIRLADLLIAEGIPVLYVGDLIERAAVKDLLCLLDLFAASGSAGPALLRRTAALCGGLNDPAALFDWAKQLEPGVHSIADRILADEKMREAEPNLVRMLQDVGIDRRPDAILARFLFDRPEYLRVVDAALAADPLAGAVRLLSIRRLIEIAEERGRVYAREFGEARDPDSGGAAIDSVSWFVREIRRYGAAGERITAMSDPEDGIDAVRIMTVHAAKGLEFPAVFLPNLTEGNFPQRDRAPFLAEPRGLTADRMMGDFDQEEEACLFFVALSRARDHLILSRTEMYGPGGRSMKPSSFLTLIGEGLEQLGVRPIFWRSQAAEAAEPSAKSDRTLLPARFPKPRFSASELELYQRCPKLYFYRKAQGLSGAEQTGDGARYRECLRVVTAWMQDEWRGGRLPDEAQVTERVTAFWTEAGVPMELYRQLALDRSLEVALQTRAGYAARFPGETPAPDRVLSTELANCVVHVSADLISVGREGGVRVVRQLDGKTGDDDHTHPRLSLLRSGMTDAFKDRPGRIELTYSQTGEARSVPLKAQFEPGRLRKYELAADGILRGSFEPAPADPRQCPTCPYHFICPE